MNSIYDDLGVKTTEELLNEISNKDNIQSMTTEDILKKNVYDLQEQLAIANTKIISLMDTVRHLNKKLNNAKFTLEGINIYINDVKKELLNDPL